MLASFRVVWPGRLRAVMRLIGLAAAAVTFVFAPEAQGADPSAPELPARVAWSLRPNGGVGIGGVVDGEAGLAGRAGIDGEYWLTDNIGIGAALGYQASTTFPQLWPADSGFTGSDHRVSVAPAITFQVSNRVGSPIVTLAAGYAWGHSKSSSFCDSVDPNCMPSNNSGDSSGLFASLAATWMFHVGRLQAGSVAPAIGPVARLDAWTLHDRWEAGLAFDGWTVTATVGLAVGFDVVRAAVP